MPQTRKTTKRLTKKTPTRTTGKSKLFWWQRRPRNQAAIVAIIFGLIGIALLWQAFAATATVVYTGQLNSKKPSVSYTVVVSAPGTLTAKADYTKLNRLGVEIFDTYGNVLASNSNGNPVVLTQNVTPGTYTVKLTGAGRGNYTLSLSYPVADTIAPTVNISTPTNTAVVSGGIAVTGVANDNEVLSAVAVQVDGGNWLAASGTTNWSYNLDTASLTNGTHTVTAKATDGSGNNTTKAITINVYNAPAADTTAPQVAIGAPVNSSTLSGTTSVSGTASDNLNLAKVEVAVDSGAWQSVSGTANWTWSWNTTALANGTHTLTARATDSSGNVSTAAVTVTVSNSTGTVVWTSPEGVRIEIQTTEGGWTPESIYNILKPNARNLDKIGPTLKVVVQNKYPSLSTIAASSANGRYTSINATIQLDARSSTGFSLRADDIITHEYGHVWNNYYGYIKWQDPNWAAYLNKRWVTADGSTTLATDSRTGLTYTWTPDEIAADDYRLLFGTEKAIMQRNANLNQQIPDPRNQPGLKDWFLTTWSQ